MGSPIVMLDGKYLLWCTSADAPASYGLTRAELVEHVRAEYGRRGVDELDRRLAHVHEKGASSFDAKSADDTIWLNRAGPDEKPLHRDEIIHFYVRRTEELTPAALKAFRKGLPRCGPSCVQRPVDGCATWCKRCWGTDFVRGEA